MVCPLIRRGTNVSLISYCELAPKFPTFVIMPSSARFKHVTPAWSRSTGSLLGHARPLFRQAWMLAARSPRADAAQRQAFDRILGNHMLYCTVCDNNNGNCTVHNTTKMLAVEHQKIPFK